MRNRQSKSLVLYLFTTYLNRSGAYYQDHVIVESRGKARTDNKGESFRIITIRRSRSRHKALFMTSRRIGTFDSIVIRAHLALIPFTASFE